MKSSFLFILIAIIYVVCSVIFLVGCSSFSPKNDKNVSYTFETISYQSPNSPSSANPGSIHTIMRLPISIK